MHPDAESSTRREFLRGALAVAGASALSVSSAAAADDAIPTVTIAGVKIPRMIVGCNQIGGWSHGSRALATATTDFYNLERTTAFLRDCVSVGLDVCHSYWDDKPLKAFKALWSEGVQIRPYFLGTLEEGGTISKELLEYRPIWHAHHGNVTDGLFREGKQERVHDFVKKVHDVLGIPAGISAHNPDVFKYAEDKGWEADFYTCCLYYVTRPQEEIRAKLGAVPLGESFLDTDRDTMLNLIRQIKKPCIAFKILGAGRLIETGESVEDAFQYALSRIKKTDAIMVGMWTKYRDELRENLGYLKQYGKVA